MVGLAAVTLIQTPPPPRNHTQDVRIKALHFPTDAESQKPLGPFRLKGVWQLESPNNYFGGYSALLSLGSGQFLTISDRGYYLKFSAPGAMQKPPYIGRVFRVERLAKANRDAESATRDPVSGRLWIGWEHRNLITRHAADLAEQGEAHPKPMWDWNRNAGPEAMVRLSDGHFIVLGEMFAGSFERSRHPAVFFPGDPVEAADPQPFTFVGPEGFRPTDMAQLPDGRVLVLMRRLLWPVPARFEGRIAIADPAAIRAGGEWRATEIATIAAPLPNDNFEGLAIEPGSNGKLNVWLIADANDSAFQRTLLWRLELDPARLPNRSPF